MIERYGEVVERGRRRHGEYATLPGDRSGAFLLERHGHSSLMVLASDGGGWAESGLPGLPWEHLSVTVRTRTGGPAARCPTWDEMCWVKSLFFRPDELVVQFHPPEAEAVNVHAYCLHLWRPVGQEVPVPPGICVGPKGLTLVGGRTLTGGR